MSVQGSAVIGAKAGAIGMILDKNGGIYASLAVGPGVSMEIPATVSFGVVKDKNYINSISGYFGVVTAQGGVGESVGISESGAVAQINISPSVELSVAAGKVWYIGNIWEI